MSKILLAITIAFGLGAVWWWAIFGMSQEIGIALYITGTTFGTVALAGFLYGLTKGDN